MSYLLVPAAPGFHCVGPRDSTVTPPVIVAWAFDPEEEDQVPHPVTLQGVRNRYCEDLQVRTPEGEWESL